MARRVSAVSVGLGALVGVLWIVTAPADGERAAELGGWLATLSAPALAFWLAVRVAGTAVLVPIAEELAFRGYLHRKLVSAHFETVAPGQFTWLAFLVSSAAFGLVHDRWLAGALAGAVFALAMYRTGRHSDPIAAHMAANAVIAAWAIAAGAWHLL
jgi:exosortase E/protease (VPEID-CTERM system)